MLLKRMYGVITLSVLFLSLLIFGAYTEIAVAQSYQTWTMTVTSSGSQQTGTIGVTSDGQLTGSGFRGSTSEGGYDIIIRGQMTGTSINFYQTADYDNGQGFMYADASGTLNAAFPSATSASGTIEGYLNDPFGYREFTMAFTATKTAGSSGDGGSGGEDFLDFDFSEYVPYIVAGAVAFAVVGAAVAVTKSSGAKKARQNQQLQGSMGPLPQQSVQWREKRPVNPLYEQPNPPADYQTTQNGTLPPPIRMDNGIPITGQGASVVPPDLSNLPFLTGVWGPGNVTLNWATPQFNPSRYALLGYDISQSTYGPTSTAPQLINLGRVGPGATSTNVPFGQTFRWNTAGDIAGFRVDPVYGLLDGNGQVISQVRSGGMLLRFGQVAGFLG